MRPLALLAAVLCVAGCGGGPAKRDSQAVDGQQPELLVMVEETAPPRFQPGAVGPGGYSGTPLRTRSLRLAQAIAQDHGLRLQTDWSMPALGVRCFVMSVPQPRTPESVLSGLETDQRVESAQAVQRFAVAGQADPYVALQSGARLLRLDALHRIATGKGVTVAQVDTGVEREHPDLVDGVVSHRNFVDGSRYRAEVHGTAVAGIIVAARDNGVGMVGVAPDAHVLALRACWEQSPHALAAACDSFTLAKALQHALSRRAQVINLSLTGPRDRLLERLLDVAARRGVVLVGAVEGQQPGFPGANPNVIGVSAGLSVAPGVALVAPGTQVLSTAPEGTWGYFSGASFAAAHVTGVVAVLLERAPGLTPAAVREALAPGAGAASPSMLDACAALARAAGTAPQGVTRPAARSATGC
jgi:subtilisin family serine protease